MNKNNTPADVTIAYRRYLLGRGRATMADICEPFPRLHGLAATQDSIGFDNFIIGRLPKALLPLVQPSLQKANRRGLTPTFWAKASHTSSSSSPTNNGATAKAPYTTSPPKEKRSENTSPSKNKSSHS
jgi:hypothetical protein